MFSDDGKPASENQELPEAIKRTFKQLDDDIAQAALASEIKECQFGGTTALMALINGRLSRADHACTLGDPA